MITTQALRVEASLKGHDKKESEGPPQRGRDPQRKERKYHNKRMNSQKRKREPEKKEW